MLCCCRWFRVSVPAGGAVGGLHTSNSLLRALSLALPLDTSCKVDTFDHRYSRKLGVLSAVPQLGSHVAVPKLRSVKNGLGGMVLKWTPSPLPLPSTSTSTTTSKSSTHTNSTSQPRPTNTQTSARLVQTATSMSAARPRLRYLFGGPQGGEGEGEAEGDGARYVCLACVTCT